MTPLDKQIDYKTPEIPKHLGKIADSMAEWEGRISDELGLTIATVANIKKQEPHDLKLQS